MTNRLNDKARTDGGVRFDLRRIFTRQCKSDDYIDGLKVACLTSREPAIARTTAERLRKIGTEKAFTALGELVASGVKPAMEVLMETANKDSKLALRTLENIDAVELLGNCTSKKPDFILALERLMGKGIHGAYGAIKDNATNSSIRVRKAVAGAMNDIPVLAHRLDTGAQRIDSLSVLSRMASDDPEESVRTVALDILAEIFGKTTNLELRTSVREILIRMVDEKPEVGVTVIQKFAVLGQIQTLLQIIHDAHAFFNSLGQQGHLGNGNDAQCVAIKEYKTRILYLTIKELGRLSRTRISLSNESEHDEIACSAVRALGTVKGVEAVNELLTTGLMEIEKTGRMPIQSGQLRTTPIILDEIIKTLKTRLAARMTTPDTESALSRLRDAATAQKIRTD